MGIITKVKGMMSNKPYSEDQGFIMTAQDRFQRAYDASRRNYQQAKDDLEFLYKDMGHWSNELIKDRERLGQPTLQIDALQKYARQVDGEGRRSKVSVKVRPTDSEADIEIANLRAGKIKDIEYKSRAEAIYDFARKQVIDCGHGAWRYLTRSKKTNPFEQEIYLEIIRNPFTVFMDPDAKDPLYRDARYGFIITKYTNEEFKRQYPNEDVFSTNGRFAPMTDTMRGFWYDNNMVAVIEYFYIENKKKRMAHLSDGRIMLKKDADEIIAQAIAMYDSADTQEQQKAIGEEREPNLSDRSQLPTIVNEIDVDDNQVNWCKMTAAGIIEQKNWAGLFIPIVKVRGEIVDIDGDEYVFGLIHNAKDPQKMHDYWQSGAAENIALAPKAPYMGTPTMFKDFEKEYARAHKENLPYLHYNIDPLNPNARPERVQPPTPPVAMMQMIAQSENNIKGALGMFNADVGDQGRELSGVAIERRQMPGDTATYMFLDNISQAIAYGGEILNDLIPKIYDTDQDARLRNDDDSETFAPINTTIGKAMERIQKNPARYAGIDINKLSKAAQEKGINTPYNDITVGEYDVIITTGPSFQTQRQEAAAYLKELTVSATGTPLFNLLMHFATKYLDFESAQEISDAIRKTLPQGILPPKPGEEPPKPPPPTPQEQMMMQAQKIKLETDMINRQVQLEKTLVEAERRRTEQMQQMVNLVKLINEGKDAAVDRQASSLLATLQGQVKQMPERIGGK